MLQPLTATSQISQPVKVSNEAQLWCWDSAGAQSIIKRDIECDMWEGQFYSCVRMNEVQQERIESKDSAIVVLKSQVVNSDGIAYHNSEQLKIKQSALDTCEKDRKRKRGISIGTNAAWGTVAIALIITIAKRESDR